MLGIRSIHHVALLTTSDLYETTKKFYTEILGFTIVAEHFRSERDSYKLDLALEGKYQLEIFSFPDYRERASFPEAMGLRHLAFAVTDVRAGHEWLKKQQVKVEDVRKDPYTGKCFLFFYDPNNQPLELYEL
ncbi:MAG: VOC family protein [Bacteroidota bacterium]|nr:VOC family protein [Bacteroidota bacterium]